MDKRLYTAEFKCTIYKKIDVYAYDKDEAEDYAWDVVDMAADEYDLLELVHIEDMGVPYDQ